MNIWSICKREWQNDSQLITLPPASTEEALDSIFPESSESSPAIQQLQLSLPEDVFMTSSESRFTGLNPVQDKLNLSFESNTNPQTISLNRNCAKQLLASLANLFQCDLKPRKQSLIQKYMNDHHVNEMPIAEMPKLKPTVQPVTQGIVEPAKPSLEPKTEIKTEAQEPIQQPETKEPINYISVDHEAIHKDKQLLNELVNSYFNQNQ